MVLARLILNDVSLLCMQALCMLDGANAQFWRCMGVLGTVEWCIYISWPSGKG